MFNRSNDNADALKLAYAKLQRANPGTDEYDRIIDSITKLTELQTEKSKTRISKDVLVNGAVSLAGILIVVSYEHAHPLASKALGFVKKP